MKELWNKLSKQEKIQVGGGAIAVALGSITLFSSNWHMGVALISGGAVITYINVKKHL